MIELFKSFEFHKDNDPENKRPFMMACRDYESKDERWVLAHLTEQEAQTVYEELGKALGKD